MNMDIKKTITTFLKSHPKISNWVWFVLLWCGGLLTALAIAAPVKALIKLASAL